MFQLTGLGPDELKVAELVGIDLGLLSKKATGIAGKMVSQNPLNCHLQRADDVKIVYWLLEIC